MPTSYSHGLLVLKLLTSLKVNSSHPILSFQPLLVNPSSLGHLQHEDDSSLTKMEFLTEGTFVNIKRTDGECKGE